MAGLNEALRARAAGAKLLRTARVRADTTVIGANVAYPTDAGLLAKAVGKLVRAARRVQAAGGATGTVMTGRRRAAGGRARAMAATMRARARLGRDESSRAISRVTGDLADLAEAVAGQAAAVLRNGRRAIRRALSGRMRGRLRRALGDLAVTIERTGTVVAQARTRLAGQMPGGATRLVSLHDPDAHQRPATPRRYPYVTLIDIIGTRTLPPFCTADRSSFGRPCCARTGCSGCDRSSRPPWGHAWRGAGRERDWLLAGDGFWFGCRDLGCEVNQVPRIGHVCGDLHRAGFSGCP